MIFYLQKMLQKFAVEQKEERKREESIQQFCDGCCLLLLLLTKVTVNKQRVGGACRENKLR